MSGGAASLIRRGGKGVTVDSRDRAMRIQAIHTFPDDYAIVKTQSVFKLP